jgi:hypothetical protein
MSTPKMDSFSPNAYLINNSSQGGNMSSGASAGALSGIINAISSPFNGLGMQGTPPYE